MKIIFRSMMKIFQLLTEQDRMKAFFLLSVMILAAIFEVLGIGMVLPFIGLLSNPDKVHSLFGIDKLYTFFTLSTDLELLTLLGCTIMLLFVVKNTLSIFLIWLQSSFYMRKQHEIQAELFESYLSAPYIFHIKHNSATLIRNITSEVSSVCNGILGPLLVIISESIILMFIVSFLAFMNPLVIGSTIILVALLFGSLAKWMNPRVAACGEIRLSYGGKIIKEVNQGLGGIKAVRVSHEERFFCNKFGEDVQKFSKATKRFVTLNAIPRAAAESFSVILIIGGMLVALSMGVKAVEVVTTMTIFAVAFIRLMPSASKIIGALNALVFNQPSLNVVCKELDVLRKYVVDYKTEDLACKNVQFRDLEFNNVSYTYPQSIYPAINNISLKISTGESVAFVGKSGAGKSTLIEVLLGLLKCDKGEIRVDGENINDFLGSWMKTIGYVPQSIYILDDTVRRNIAFGIKDDCVDDEQIWSVLKKASMDEKIRCLPDGLDTMLGERGARLSGGEIQRIGIARALYSKPKLLVFDEATSALDNETEQALSQTINALMGSVTLVIIAHRLSTVKKCNTIYFMEDGNVIDAGSFEKLVECNDKFKSFSASGG